MPKVRPCCNDAKLPFHVTLQQRNRALLELAQFIFRHRELRHTYNPSNNDLGEHLLPISFSSGKWMPISALNFFWLADPHNLHGNTASHRVGIDASLWWFRFIRRNVHAVAYFRCCITY